MALVKCKQCGTEVANNAATCPQCGAKVPRGMSTGKILLLIFGGLGVCFFGTCMVGAVGMARSKPGGAGSSSGASSTAAASARYVDIHTLLSEYADNQVRADSTFKGRYVQIDGVVNDVRRDVLNTIYVTLGSSQLEVLQVQCFFNEGQAKRAASLSRGSRVSVRGRVDGMLMNVLMKDCEFL